MSSSLSRVMSLPHRQLHGGVVDVGSSTTIKRLLIKIKK